MRYLIAMLLIVAGAAAAAPAQTIEQMQALVARQQAQLDQQAEALDRLQSQLSDDWMDGRRAEQVKALVREVLADAETRASLLDSPITAGHDGSFFVASADGMNRLNFKGLLQARYVFNHQENAPDDDDRGGFEIGRTRFSFSGHVIDPSWQFMIWTGHHFNGDAMLLDAWIKKVLDDNWSVTAGQFKVPFWREWLVSETRQQFVERSLLNAFSGSYTQGVKVDYSNERLHATFAFTDGAGNLNRSWDTEDTDVALTGRAEWLVFGDWKQYGQFESWRDDEQPMLVLGAAVHYQEGESGTVTDETDLLRWTVDGSLEFGGANLFAAVVGDHVDNGVANDRIGTLVQGGYFITDKVELIARYEWADLDQAVDETLSIATVGVNYFFAKHRARWTLDVGYAFEPVSGTIDSTFAGYRADSVGESGQTVVRTQMQLVF